MFVAGSLAWGMALDGFRPDRYDVIRALICWLPYLGWGWLGAAQTPQIGVATLVLHLLYGLTLGLLLDRAPRRATDARQ